jgi:hypothetical protein
MNVSTSAYNAPAANTAAVATIPGAGAAGVSGVNVLWSYSATPTNGNLLIQHGSTTILSLDITNAGPGFLPIPISNTGAQNLVATLAAGGTGVLSKIALIGTF